jgi:hypothetical protein
MAVDRNRADSLNSIYPEGEPYHLGKTDQANAQSLLMNNSEWVTGNQESFQSKHPIWNTIYKTKANFFEVNEKDFFLAVNPVLQFQLSNQTGNSQQVYLNTKGLTFRGKIGDHVGFSSYITDNQERGPDFFTQRVFASGYPAVPGEGYFKYFKSSTSAFVLGCPRLDRLRTGNISPCSLGMIKILLATDTGHSS